MIDVRNELRQAILTGELVAGSVISSVQLANKYGVSRTPMREALRMLQEEGFVTIAHNQRPRVATFSSEELEAVFAQRMLLSALCTSMTVPALTAADLDEMGRLLDEVTAAEQRGDLEAWQEADPAFHNSHTMHAPAAIQSDLDKLTERSQMFRYMWLGQRLTSMDLSMDDHHDIYEACVARDAPRAAAVAARHLATVAITLLARTDPAHEPIAVRQALRLASSASA
ncbi:GntR family transcriptional regulator [Subtercola lobariae]|uniref:GntR family transcriptional regulator n=2 Tax=Subtercola lobariae TaxID=1588641 RepID=A0A917EV92_9MICO|nr:GntR family transcriptional regulator [Subtercola lobariae]